MVWAYDFELDRPSDAIDIDRRFERSYSDSEASAGVGVHICTYRERPAESPYLRRDGVVFRVVATGNTRKGIVYRVTAYNWLGDWVHTTWTTGITGDDDGVRLDLPFKVRFYGGPGYKESFTYTSVWVCSNGFLSFESTTSTSPNPMPIPHPSPPNALIAPYWTDLDPTGGSITYYSSCDVFIVTWNNVLDKRNGARQTFQVVIFSELTWGIRGQNKIIFQYKNLTANGYHVWGIEDQEGFKSFLLPSYFPPSFPASNQRIEFWPENRAAEIRKITIKIEKNDVNAQIIVGTGHYERCGQIFDLQAAHPITIRKDYMS